MVSLTVKYLLFLTTSLWRVVKNMVFFTVRLTLGGGVSLTLKRPFFYYFPKVSEIVVPDVYCVAARCKCTTSVSCSALRMLLSWF